MNYKMKKALHECLWFLFFLLIAIVIFYKVTILKQQTFLNSFDNTMQSYVWYFKQSNALKLGEVALWDFNISSGTSFVGEIQPASLYPLNIIFCLLAGNITQYKIDIFIVLHFAMAAYFMFLFLKNNKIKIIPCIFGSILFSFIGSVANRAYGQANIFMGLVYLPLVMLFFKRALECKDKLWKNKYIYFTGLTLAISILAGHMQPYIHIVVCLCFYVVFMSNKFKNGNGSFISNLVKLIACGMVSILAGFGQIYAGIEYMISSYRWISLENPVKGLEKIPLEAYDIFVLRKDTFSDLFFNTHLIDEGGALFFTVIGLILAIIAIYKRNRLTNFSLFISIFCVVMSMGRQNIFGTIGCYIPIFNNVREPVRILYLYNFSVAILATIGFESIITKLSNNEKTWNKFTKCKINSKNIEVIRKAVFYTIIVCCVSNVTYNAIIYNGHNLTKIGEGYNPDSYYSEIDAIKFLSYLNEKEGNIYRFVNDENQTLPPNIGDKFINLFSTRGHRATMQINYFDYLCRDWNYASENFKKLGYKYIISKNQLEGFKQIYYDGIYYIYEKENAMSMFTIKNNNTIENADVSNVLWKTNSVSFTLNSNGGKLIFAQPSYPGWKVYINDKKTELVNDDIFQAINVTEGKQDIKISYEPIWIKIWVISLSILIIGLGVCFIGKEGTEKNKIKSV